MMHLKDVSIRRKRKDRTSPVDKEVTKYQLSAFAHVAGAQSAWL
jgi:hypothetical protein